MTPIIQVEIDGQSSSQAAALSARTMAVRIVKHDGGHADEMTLHLSNYDGLVAKPKKGATLNVALGFVETGLGVAGSFEVQTVTKLGMTATFEVTGHSADLNKSWKQQKHRSWLPPKTLGDVLDEVAGDNGCTAAVSPELRGVKIEKVLAQNGESDMHLWTRLARQYGAVGKVAGGKAVFTTAGSGQSASGAGMTPFVVTPNDLEDGWRIADKDRPKRGTVKGHFYDRAAGKRIEVTSAGTEDDDGAPAYTFPQTFGSETEAQHAVDARKREFSRAEKSFSGRLKSGSTQVEPGGVITSQTFGDDDDGDWILKRVTHDAVQGAGYVTEFEGEVKRDQ